jgi:hypothetical protein
MYGSGRSALFFLFLSWAGCGLTGITTPEGFSQSEWRAEQGGHPELAQAHQWIAQSPVRREQRGLAVEGCFRAYAFAHPDAEGILDDFAQRKRYYRRVNTTWLPALALKAQRGEGEFGLLLAQALEDEIQRCWNPKSVAALREASQKIRAL